MSLFVSYRYTAAIGAKIFQGFSNAILSDKREPANAESLEDVEYATTKIARTEIGTELITIKILFFKEV